MLKGAFWSGFCYKGKPPTLLVNSRRSWNFVLHYGKCPGKENTPAARQCTASRKKDWEIFQQPPYNPDLVPSDQSYSYSFTDLDRPLGFQEAESTRILNSRHMKVVRFSALRTVRLYPQEISLLLIYVTRRVGLLWQGGLSQLKKPNDLVGNRTRNLPSCSTVPPSN